MCPFSYSLQQNFSANVGNTIISVQCRTHSVSNNAVGDRCQSVTCDRHYCDLDPASDPADSSARAQTVAAHRPCAAAVVLTRAVAVVQKRAAVAADPDAAPVLADPVPAAPRDCS